MYRILALLTVVGAAVGQQPYGDPRTAAILSEQRYLSGDGSFGAQYTQEDGVQFKEESLPDGSRRGTYSYIDPTGAKKTVTYTAGKHGFHASGDHIPQPPPTVLPVAPQPQYQPLPQYNPPPQQQYNSQPRYQPQPQQQPQPQYQPQYNPPQQNYDNGEYYQTTPAPHRFYPPGKLSLNRSPDGFSYSFNKV